jgi:hypothetical protein
MKRRQTNALVISVLALSLAAAAAGVRAQPPSDTPGAASAQAAAPAAQRHEAVLRSWQDRVKIDGRDQPRRFEIVFDYRLGVTRRRVYDEQDRLIFDEAIAEQPRRTAAELAKAFDTVRRDPELGRLARSVNAKLDGGFLLREAAGKPCGPRTRCLQVFILSESRRELHRRPVVDVSQRGRIAHRDYKPSATD